MSLSLRLSPLRTHLTPALLTIPQSILQHRHYADLSTSNYGKKQAEHTTDKSSSLNIQASASKSGQEQKASGDETSQGMSQKDDGNNNERAKKDHPEAPGPVIGMNDERGGKGH